MKKKILMICLGNICRSPLAQGILEKKVKEQNLDWIVDSAGTASYHSGELPDSRSIQIAKENGINITNQRSRKVTIKDFSEFDLILAMDASNYNNLRKQTKTEIENDKIKMILNYAHPGENRQVPDPYYEGGFDRVFHMLEEACNQLIIVES